MLLLYKSILILACEVWFIDLKGWIWPCRVFLRVSRSEGLLFLLLLIKRLLWTIIITVNFCFLISRKAVIGREDNILCLHSSVHLVISNLGLIVLSIDMAHIQSPLIELDLCAELAIACLNQGLSEIYVLIAYISSINVLQLALSIIPTQQMVTEQA